jgi:hypothetical protein
MDKQERIQNVKEEIRAYRTWLDDQLGTREAPEAVRAAPEAARVQVKIVAEGDSWFNYIIGKDVVWWLRNKFGHEVHEVAYPGATLNHMAYGPDTSELGDRDVSNMSQLGETLFAIEENRPRIVMLSGGGNDIAGPEFIQLLKHANAPESGANQKVIEGLLDAFDEAYEVMLDAIEDKLDELDLHARIILHGYDLPFPNGEGIGLGPVNFVGPWFHESFSTRGYPDSQLEARRAILNVFMNQFNERLAAIAQGRPRVHYLDLRNTLPDEDLWANELHPKNRGFKRIARKFDDLIQDLVRGDE